SRSRRLCCPGPPRALRSFPTRRSSDLASVLGPPLGYAIVSTLGWRWVFYVNVPVGIIAVACIATTLEESTGAATGDIDYAGALRSEEHTSELQSRFDLVCRLLLEKKKH